MPHILIADDEISIRKALREILEFESYRVSEVENGEAALLFLTTHQPDLIFLDIKMKGRDGLEILEDIQKSYSDIPVIMLSGHGTIETAVKATKLGAFDFISKPPDLNRLLVAVRNALDRYTLVQKNIQMRRRIGNVNEIIGTSTAIEKVKETIHKVAKTDARVLITGENGTGKELVARWIHEHSKRNNTLFVEVNCVAIPSTLIESELFGHEKGAFTGADKQRIGKFEQANGGTLFLDEIGDMPLEDQTKLLRALQEGKISRVGGNDAIQVNVRVIAATNKDLNQAIDDGFFREDLYHRLNVIPIHIPPLRDRREDIPELAITFLNKLADTDIQFSNKHFSDKALHALCQQLWPGNVRELQNLVERLAILSDSIEISEKDVECMVSKRNKLSKSEELLELYDDFQEFKEAAEKAFIIRQLDKHDWNISQTADNIGMQRSHIYNKINKYNIKR